MATTAGSFALNDNISSDAFVVDKLKANGALILGKTNLSEWAYYFCNDCPSGYSAIGGQTLNPYGRKNLTLEDQAPEVGWQFLLIFQLFL